VRPTRDGGAAGLRAAFLGTTYGPPGERFRLLAQRGQPPSWAAKGWAAGGWALVTAWNPGGRSVTPHQNARAGAALRAQVQAAGFSPLPALNGEGEWAEPALLVRGAALRQAAGWGGSFGQAAVLWGYGARAALVWLEGGRVTAVERRWAVRLPG